MPRTSRSLQVEAGIEDVWRIVSDPYHLPRWWPQAQRIENAQGPEGGRPELWTVVLISERGKSVRADFRLEEAEEPRRCSWIQEVEATPFARILKSARTVISLDGDAVRTHVKIEVTQRLRGLSRLGSLMFRRATGRQLDEALDSLRKALVGGHS